jgi:hypothetical protein
MTELLRAFHVVLELCISSVMASNSSVVLDEVCIYVIFVSFNVTFIVLQYEV